LLVRNFDRDPHVLTLSLRFAADLPMSSRYAGKSAPSGAALAECLSPDSVVLRYRGLDGVERDTSLRLEPAPDRLDTGGADSC